MSSPHSILSTEASRNNNAPGRVTFDPSTADNTRSLNPPSTPPPAPANVTAPVVDFPIKDEVELLRSGVLNVHGTNVKSQGEQQK